MPFLTWDKGTAYDFFVSLYVLHRPSTFGLRPSWAAGVRSRLPQEQRDFLEKAQSFLPVPLRWLYLLPAEAKITEDALHSLAQTPAAERLPSLLINPDTPTEALTVLQEIALRHTWSSAEQEVLRAALHKRGIHPRPGTLNSVCEAWADLTAWGEQILLALNTYYTSFFAEEEDRIASLIDEALARAQARAGELPLPSLLDELTHGVHFDTSDIDQAVILAPSYWVSPLTLYHRLGEGEMLVLFGVRSPSEPLIPGDPVPRELLEAMKAVADPTRLQILRYLAGSPQTPSQLARQLRLRPPTVVHHLNTLRLAGLVEVSLHGESERAYSLRRETLRHAITSLNNFIEPK